MISVIIPTYNRLETLKRCLGSILSQSYEGLEVIIVDDCSKDATRSYLEGLTLKYSFIKLVFNEENYGVNYTRNRGIELATKEYILFLDSDDELVKGALLKIHNCLKKYKEVSHFLFLISYREKEFSNVLHPKKVNYKDWLTGKLNGDFTHVVLTKIMRNYLFHEEFRMFENLNWTRVFKATSPQLLVPKTTTKVEIDRSDSLSTSSRLSNITIITNTFEAQKLYYELYRSDLLFYNSQSFTYGVLKTILLGVASGRKKECEILFSYVEKTHIKILARLFITLPTFTLRETIIFYSFAKKLLISYALKLKHTSPY